MMDPGRTPVHDESLLSLTVKLMLSNEKGSLFDPFQCTRDVMEEIRLDIVPLRVPEYI